MEDKKVINDEVTKVNETSNEDIEKYKKEVSEEFEKKSQDFKKRENSYLDEINILKEKIKNIENKEKEEEVNINKENEEIRILKEEIEKKNQEILKSNEEKIVIENKNKNDKINSEILNAAALKGLKKDLREPFLNKVRNEYDISINDEGVVEWKEKGKNLLLRAGANIANTEDIILNYKNKEINKKESIFFALEDKVSSGVDIPINVTSNVERFPCYTMADIKGYIETHKIL